MNDAIIQDNTKLTILVLFGGQSSEHDVSRMSAKNVVAAIDVGRYEVLLGYIPRDGTTWQLVDSVDRQSGIEFLPRLGRSQIVIDNDVHSIDVVFPVLHGQFGEDGAVQGLAQLLHAKLVGPSLESAAITLDKQLTKKLVQVAGVPTVPSIEWCIVDKIPQYESIVTQLSATALFVKPNTAGSSVGVTKVRNASDFEAAMHEAAQFSQYVLVEKAIDAREIELAVFGNDTRINVSGAGEIIPGEEFYSFTDKYAETARSKVEIPADLSGTQLELLQKYARKAYAAVRGRGMARIDFFIDKSNGEIYLNEINAIPGFTNISMYPKLWQYEGISYTKLIDRLIELAAE